ncbi:MAG: hypothetical protein L6R39_001829 [Caloplaca ligustica]|nr:MAG: hypothetical protein L6R39_001829 [Caloplaca ligustica]
MLLSCIILSFFSVLGCCDVFMRDDCWCRNATHLGWNRHYQLHSANIEGSPEIIDEWCFQETHDGQGECLDQHTKQYEICASHPAAHNASRRNDFCYYNHGNNRGIVTHWVKGKDWISWNNHKRNIPFRDPPIPMSTEDNIKYCEPICRDYRSWNLPVMDPWSPSKHGIVESRHQIFVDITNFDFLDGAGGDWPIKPPKPKTTPVMAPSHQKILVALSELQSQPLSIIRLSEPISNPTNSTSKDSNNPRASDASTSALTDDADAQPTPASLAADLSHYRDLFSKLRFSYLEQVTKEKFLRAIVGDPPLIIENAENVELEHQLKEVKAVLKEQKEHVANMVQELEERGRELAQRYEQVGLRTAMLGRLPGEIEGLEEQVRRLKEENRDIGDVMGGGMGLEKVLEVTREKEAQREEVEREIKALQRLTPGKERELEMLIGELKGLEREKAKAVDGAREAVKSRKNGGQVGDELEIREYLLQKAVKQHKSENEALTDEYLAQLLAKDAKDRTIKYSSYGLQSYLPKRRLQTQERGFGLSTEAMTETINKAAPRGDEETQTAIPPNDGG